MTKYFVMRFKHMLILATASAALSATAQVTLPYNPDGDANGLIGVTDLQDLLSTYGGEFAPGTIMVNAVELGELLDSLQSQITALQEASEGAFRCGDDVLYEGYWYNTTSIGGQCWFSENVRYLPTVTVDVSFDDAWAYPNAYVYGYGGAEEFEDFYEPGQDDDDVEAAKNTLNYHKYGVLYNFLAIEQWNLCPSGWHVPTDEEWTAMILSLGSDNFAGSMMAADIGGSWNGTNLSGFSGLPGGYRQGYFMFSGLGRVANWWSSSRNDGNDSGPGWAIVYLIGPGDEEPAVARQVHATRRACSVRCIRDAE